MNGNCLPPPGTRFLQCYRKYGCSVNSSIMIVTQLFAHGQTSRKPHLRQYQVLYVIYVIRCSVGRTSASSSFNTNYVILPLQQRSLSYTFILPPYICSCPISVRTSSRLRDFSGPLISLVKLRTLNLVFRLIAEMLVY